ncbi:MAG: hypothetical protein JSR25_05790 [Proteobacteria bacterium]|nr:hypothetical protein [Pseudomonadota bacterium]
MRVYAFIAAIVILLGAAAGLLARTGSGEPAAQPYQVTARAYDLLEAGVTAAAILPDLGFDLSRADRLSYLAMIEQFMPENSTGFDRLDPAVQDCLTARDRCTGYVFKIAGNPNARAVVVIQSGHVVYKSVTGRLLAQAQ